MRRTGLACVALATLIAVPAAATAQLPDPTRTPSLDSLLTTRINAASKYAQTSAEAPASVTILTSDDLQRFGYRTLSQALESVRGFYVTNDRNYSYLGVRGFSRPGDYNNRVLLLVDGHTINDQTWGAAPIGGEFPINLDAVERIEIVRGPGSALYGTSAMFAVVNIVTKTGVALDGLIARARVGTGGLREGTLAGGRPFGKSSSFAVSGVVTHSDGLNLTFPEFIGPLSDGVARGRDWERAIGGMANLTVSAATARVGYRSRDKGIPTASFGTLFGDPRTQTADESLWGDVSFTREVGATHNLSARFYGDGYRYRGVYPADSGVAYSDGGGSTSFGTELMDTWQPTSRHRLTIGAELRRIARAEYFELFEDGTTSRDNAPSTIASLFAEDEFELSPSVMLVGGARLEQTSRHGSAVAPKLALVVTPSSRTTVKALLGGAFRAPSAAEADITTSYYTRNPSLDPERLRSVEIALAQRLAAPVLLSASVYSYDIRDLIDAVTAADSSGVAYRNVARSEGAGLEVELDVRPEGPFAGHVTYAYQHSDEEPANIRLANSPEHVVTASLSAATTSDVRATASWRYESGRRTLIGPSTPGSLRTDVVASYGSPKTGRGISAIGFNVRLTNLFNVRYAWPAGIEHRELSIGGDGRALTLEAFWHY